MSLRITQPWYAGEEKTIVPRKIISLAQHPSERETCGMYYNIADDTAIMWKKDRKMSVLISKHLFVKMFLLCCLFARKGVTNLLVKQQYTASKTDPYYAATLIQSFRQNIKTSHQH